MRPSAVQMLPEMPTREFCEPVVWSKPRWSESIAVGAISSADLRLSFSDAIADITDESCRIDLASPSRLSRTNVSTVPTALATAATAAWSSSPSVASVLDTPARSIMKARTSASFSANVPVKAARLVTVSNNGPALSPKVSAARASSRIISLPAAPWPSNAFRPAFSRWLSDPSLLTPLGPSARVSSWRLL